MKALVAALALGFVASTVAPAIAVAVGVTPVADRDDEKLREDKDHLKHREDRDDRGHNEGRGANTQHHSAAPAAPPSGKGDKAPRSGSTVPPTRTQKPHGPETY